MALLLGRRVRLQIGLPDEPGLEMSFADGEGFEIQWDCQHKLDSKPNKATIEVYNPRKSALGIAQQTTAIVRLLAGYSVEKQIFVGNPIPRTGAAFRLEGGDRVLKLSLQDGRQAYAKASLDRTWAAGVTVSEVVETIGGDLGSPNAPLPEELGSVQLSQGLTLSGDPRRALKSLSESIGATAMIRDGALYVIGSGDVTGEPATVFSPELGNLYKAVPRKDGIVEITGALEGSLRPGRRFVIRDHSDYDGVYKARDVSFRGSSGHDTPFDVVATGKAV